MEDPGYELAKHWSSLNLLIAPGNPEEKVQEFESGNSVMLPLDFRKYFLRVDGMLQVGGQDCDPNGFAFWPLARVKRTREECAHHSTSLHEVANPNEYFIFVDYLQWCWAYAIRLGAQAADGGQVITVGTLHARIVAGSFTEFVDLYLRDASELYPS